MANTPTNRIVPMLTELPYQGSSLSGRAISSAPSHPTRPPPSPTTASVGTFPRHHDPRPVGDAAVPTGRTSGAAWAARSWSILAPTSGVSRSSAEM
jgi:hypothetical protein